MKYRRVQFGITQAVKLIILEVLGPPNYREMEIQEIKKLYPQIPRHALKEAIAQLIAERKIEAI